MGDKTFIVIMKLLTTILVLICVIVGLIQFFIGDMITTAIFWVAAAGFEIASAIYAQSELKTDTKG